MGDMGDVFRAFNDEKRQRRQENLKKAEVNNLVSVLSNNDGWRQFTEYHWYRDLKGKRIDYYPSSGKFKYNEKWYKGGVSKFIQKLGVK